MNKGVSKIYAIFSFLTFSIMMFFGVIVYEQSFLTETTEDVSVLLNANTEVGYDSTVYVIKQDFTGQASICGGVQIARGLAVTAAHCVDNAKNIQIGRGTINYGSGQMSMVENVLIKDGWVGLADGWEVSKIVNDLAVISFGEGNIGRGLDANVDLVSPGCDYIVVGYGTRLNEGTISLDRARAKESLRVCVESYDEDLILLTPGTNQGFCFGDSGSPVYKVGTNTVIGVISSTIGQVESDLCDLNNKSLAVRLDTNRQFLARGSGTIAFNFDQAQVPPPSQSRTMEQVIAQDPNLFNSNEPQFNTIREAENDQMILIDEPIDENFSNFEDEGLQDDDRQEQFSGQMESQSTPDNTSIEDSVFSTFSGIPIELFYIYFGIVGANLLLSIVMIYRSFRGRGRVSISPQV